MNHNTLRGPLSRRTTRALYTPEILNGVTVRLLPELTPRQLASARLFGGRVIERVTADHLREGVTRNLDDIRRIFGEVGYKRGVKAYQYTSRLPLSQVSINAGLPSTQVGLHDLGETSDFKPIVIFHSPSASELLTDKPLVKDPTFRLKNDGIFIKLAETDSVARPFDELRQEQQQLAYIITSDVAEAMHHARNDGSLTIEGLIHQT